MMPPAAASEAAQRAAAMARISAACALQMAAKSWDAMADPRITGAVPDALESRLARAVAADQDARAAREGRVVHARRRYDAAVERTANAAKAG